MNPMKVVALLLALAGTVFAQTPTNVTTLPPAPPSAPVRPITIVPPPVRSIPLTPRTTALAEKPKTLGLVWSADSLTYESKPGETSAPFTFSFSNSSPAQIIIHSASTTCGCTVAQLPIQPWPIEPGSTGEIKVAMNLLGKVGTLTKHVTVNTSEGNRTLMVTTKISPPPPAENLRGDRNANMMKALADRQAVFKGDCRSCHVDPGVGKMGEELFVASCAICHDTPNRAPMVPDLRAPKGPRDHAYWHNWITHGRPGSMMPAFGEENEGPLTKEQIKSLVDYLLEHFPKGTPVPAALPATPIETGGAGS